MICRTLDRIEKSKIHNTLGRVVSFNQHNKCNPCTSDAHFSNFCGYVAYGQTSQSSSELTCYTGFCLVSVICSVCKSVDL